MRTLMLQFLSMQKIVFGLFLAVAPACSSDGGNVFDARPGSQDDGASGTIDGGTGAPDADPNRPDAIPNTAMTFFVTSTGNGANGGNLGGLAGADAKCHSLASAAGAGGRTWRAYLSTDTPTVNARDRIGTGPWHNQQGTQVASNLTTLHNGVVGTAILDELGELVPNEPLDHDILTGSTSDGNLLAGKTCSNWTDSTDNSGGQVGHADIAAEDLGDESWNSQHDPQCSEASLNSTAGTGRFYCFAID